METTVVPFDLQRMLVGDHSILFAGEIVLRTIVVYAYALLLLRWLGSRTIGQLSTVEFLLVIALGSAVGDAMFYPEVPLLHALVVVTVVVVANKLLDILISRFTTAERVIDDVPKELIVRGVLSNAFLERDFMGLGEVFQQLRHKGIEHLGQVAHAYVEPDGEVTVFRVRGEARPGLPIVPPWEVKPPPVILAGSDDNAGVLACMHCGTLHEGGPLKACPNCAHEKWTPAATTPRDATSRAQEEPVSRRQSAASGRPKSAGRQ